MDSIEKLKRSVDEAVSSMKWYRNIIKELIRGKRSPCEFCSGCEIADRHKGICESFIINEGSI